MPDDRGTRVVAPGLGRRFTIVWTADSVSNLADGVVAVAGPLLIASVTRDPLLVAGLFAVKTLPWLLFSLLSGALVDRVDRRRAMVAADAVRAVAIGALALSVVADLHSVALIYAVYFVLGSAETLFDNASAALLPSVVGEEHLERANGRLYGTRILMQNMIAAPVGGFLFAATQSGPFLLDAVLFAGAVVLICLLPGRFAVPRVADAAVSTLRSEIAEGVRWLWRHRLLRAIGLALALMNLTLDAAVAILVLYAQDRLGLGPVGYGVLLSSFAVGGIVGSLLGARLIRALGPGTILRGGLIIEASTHLCLALTHSAVVAGVVLAVFAVHGTLWGIVGSSLRQSLTPAHLMGRVNSGHLFLGYGGSALGAVLGGVLASTLGLTAPFWCGLVAVAALAVVAWPVLGNASIRAARAAAGLPVR